MAGRERTWSTVGPRSSDSDLESLRQRTRDRLRAHQLQAEGVESRLMREMANREQRRAAADLRQAVTQHRGFLERVFDAIRLRGQMRSVAFFHEHAEREPRRAAECQHAVPGRQLLKIAADRVQYFGNDRLILLGSDGCGAQANESSEYCGAHHEHLKFIVRPLKGAHHAKDSAPRDDSSTCVPSYVRALMRLSFGNFVIDFGERRMLSSDREIHLTPKAFDLL